MPSPLHSLLPVKFFSKTVLNLNLRSIFKHYHSFPHSEARWRTHNEAWLLLNPPCGILSTPFQLYYQKQIEGIKKEMQMSSYSAEKGLSLLGSPCFNTSSAGSAHCCVLWHPGIEALKDPLEYFHWYLTWEIWFQLWLFSLTHILPSVCTCCPWL